jgi:hypothetical protein
LKLKVEVGARELTELEKVCAALALALPVRCVLHGNRTHKKPPAPGTIQ